MFSKASKSDEAPSRSEEIPRSAAPVMAEESKSRPSVPSIISADLKIVGDLHSGGDLQIDGAVEGDIRCSSLTIGESAVVRGTMVADMVRVYGSVIGELRANSVILSKTAKVEGDIAHQSLTMEAGAELSGTLSRLETKIAATRPAEPVTAASRSNGSGLDEADSPGA
jgi:cytoskeletal protein CcmA (bactofilin family)